MQSAQARGRCVYKSICTGCAPDTPADLSDYRPAACSFEMCESVSRPNTHMPNAICSASPYIKAFTSVSVLSNNTWVSSSITPKLVPPSSSTTLPLVHTQPHPCFFCDRDFCTLSEQIVQSAARGTRHSWVSFAASAQAARPASFWRLVWRWWPSSRPSPSYRTRQRGRRATGREEGWSNAWHGTSRSNQ